MWRIHDFLLNFICEPHKDAIYMLSTAPYNKMILNVQCVLVGRLYNVVNGT